jgi:hypothetical protein
LLELSTAIPNADFVSFRVVSAYSNAELGLVFAGGGLTADEIAALNTAWNTYLLNLVP